MAVSQRSNTSYTHLALEDSSHGRSHESKLHPRDVFPRAVATSAASPEFHRHLTKRVELEISTPQPLAIVGGG